MQTQTTTIQDIKTVSTKITDVETIEEVMDLGGINWEVSKRPMVVRTCPSVGQQDLRYPRMISGKDVADTEDPKEFMPIPSHYSIVRDDQNIVLGVMQRGYLPVQNKECMNIIEPLFLKKEITVRRIGIFDNGQNVWVICEMPIKMEIGNDEMVCTLKLSWSHDGSERVTIRFMAWSNRFRVYISPKITEKRISNTISVRHTKNAKERISIAEDIINKGLVYFQHVQKKLEELVEIPYTVEELETLLEKMFPTKGEKKVNEDGYEESKIGGRALTIRGQVHTDVQNMYAEHEPDIVGTKYAALISICEHADNKGVIRVQGRDKMTDEEARKVEAQQRLKNSWNGTANNLKQKAFELLMKG